jgi:anti-sigma B factor antagonist
MSHQLGVQPGPLARFDWTAEQVDGTYTLRFNGELDMAVGDKARQAISVALDSGSAMVLLDLRGLQFMDSTGLHVILTARERAHLTRKRLEILRPSRMVYRVFEIAGLGGHLEFRDP